MIEGQFHRYVLPYSLYLPSSTIAVESLI
jgi:hypothetical protein